MVETNVPHNIRTSSVGDESLVFLPVTINRYSARLMHQMSVRQGIPPMKLLRNIVEDCLKHGPQHIGRVEETDWANGSTVSRSVPLTDQSLGMLDTIAADQHTTARAVLHAIVKDGLSRSGPTLCKGRP